MEENKQDLGKNFKDELKIESSELLNKLHGLTYFIYSDKFANIKDKAQRLLILLQHEIMKDYNSILKQRISNINESEDLDLKVGIGIIKNCLIFGLPVRRKSWNKNLVVLNKDLLQSIRKSFRKCIHCLIQQKRLFLTMLIISTIKINALFAIYQPEKQTHGFLR